MGGDAPSVTTPAPVTGLVPGATWQWQLDGPLDMSVEADVYDVDLFDVSATTVRELQGRGADVICYLSAGSVEAWRPDAGRFPAGVVGKPLDGWPGERWLDIRRYQEFAPLMLARLDLCRDKGFDAVEADNVDAYQADTGFALTGADQLAYNRWFAAEARARGLAVGLKNDREQVRQLVSSFDFAIEEECFEYGECGLLQPFVDAGKPVLVAEYAGCPQRVPAGFSVIHKRLDLGAWRRIC